MIGFRYVADALLQCGIIGQQTAEAFAGFLTAHLYGNPKLTGEYAVEGTKFPDAPSRLKMDLAMYRARKGCDLFGLEIRN